MSYCLPFSKNDQSRFQLYRIIRKSKEIKSYFELFIEFVNSSCPAGFELVREGECRGFVNFISNTTHDVARENVIARCEALPGQPVIIHDEEVRDIDYFAHYTVILASNVLDESGRQDLANHHNW